MAEKARNKVQHAKHISKMRRLNEECRSETKRQYLSCKLQEAADRRKERYSVKTGAIPKVRVVAVAVIKWTSKYKGALFSS